MAGRSVAGDAPPQDEAEAVPGGDGSTYWALAGGVDDDDCDQTTSTDYRRRCQLLETSLVKFKDKATRVRQLFTIKVRLSVCPSVAIHVLRSSSLLIVCIGSKILKRKKTHKSKF